MATAAVLAMMGQVGPQTQTPGISRQVRGPFGKTRLGKTSLDLGFGVKALAAGAGATPQAAGRGVAGRVTTKVQVARASSRVQALQVCPTVGRPKLLEQLLLAGQEKEAGKRLPEKRLPKAGNQSVGLTAP